MQHWCQTGVFASLLIKSTVKEVFFFFFKALAEQKLFDKLFKSYFTATESKFISICLSVGLNVKKGETPSLCFNSRLSVMVQYFTYSESSFSSLTVPLQNNFFQSNGGYFGGNCDILFFQLYFCAKNHTITTTSQC